LVAMIVVISINFSFGGDGGGGDEAEAGDEYSDLYALLGPMVATSAVMPILLSCVSLRAMITHPTELIKASLFVTLGINLIMAIVGFVLGFLWLGIFSLLIFSLMVCYSRAVWSRYGRSFHGGEGVGGRCIFQYLIGIVDDLVLYDIVSQ